MRTVACPAPFSSRMNGENTFMKISVGFTTSRAVASARFERDRLGGQLAEDDVQRGGRRRRRPRRLMLWAVVSATTVGR